MEHDNEKTYLLRNSDLGKLPSYLTKKQNQGSNNTLRNLWKECNLFPDTRWSYATDTTESQGMLEKESFFYLLAGLKEEHDYVLGGIVYTFKRNRLEGKLAATDMGQTKKLGDVDGLQVDIGRYHTLVGKLIYLSHTRQNISFVIGLVSQLCIIP